MNEVVVEVEIVIALGIVVVLVIGFRIWSLIMFIEDKILFFSESYFVCMAGAERETPTSSKNSHAAISAHKCVEQFPNRK